MIYKETATNMKKNVPIVIYALVLSITSAYIVFDGAARALQAAADIRTAVGSIGLEIHAGIHTGEVELVPGNIRGLAVHETARIMALAGAGEILVSSTTKDLVSAPGVTFEDRGRHVLKGVPGERQVYAATVEG
jgi:class 3 adenylate cyclase